MVSESSESDIEDEYSNERSKRVKRKGIDFKRGSYARIPDETRAKLIELVEGGVGVVHASRKLGIKYTTGKHIVRRYRRTGSFIDKRFKKTDDQLLEQPQTELPAVPSKPIARNQLQTNNWLNDQKVLSLQNMQNAVPKNVAKQTNNTTPNLLAQFSASAKT